MYGIASALDTSQRVLEERSGTRRSVWGIDRATAIRMAKIFALDKQLIRPDIASFREMLDDGKWLVGFSYDVEHARVFRGWDLIITISNEGECAVLNDGNPGIAACCETMRVPPSIINEQTVEFIAKSYAMKTGLLPPETAVEAVGAPNGDWLIGFTRPMVQAANHEEPARSRAAHVAVYVDPMGACSIIPTTNEILR